MIELFWEPEIGKRSLRCLYRGLVLTVYTGEVRLRGLISWQVEAWQEGISPDVPAAEWDIAITGLSPDAPAAKLAAERCGGKLLEAIAMIERARVADDEGGSGRLLPHQVRELVAEPPSAADSEPGVL